MSMLQNTLTRSISINWGIVWLVIATLAAAIFFMDGLDALLTAWQRPEYSHGPLIPVLSGLLFLRQLKTVPVEPGVKRDRWVGVTVLIFAVFCGALGKIANISDIVAYATIIWVFGILLVSFGWKTGKHFWPPVVHLVYMLPLPGVLYFKMSTWLQFVSSELGVYFLQLMSVPVFLEGNIIDLGVLKLHVAEACSGLRYLFPILSFSYIFAVLYRGPMWHKAVLLISAAPITVVMNSVRIAVAGVIAQRYGVEWLDGFSHFFEGWVIFVLCILLLFLLAWALLFFQKGKMSLVEALDLDTDGLAQQAGRIRLIQPSTALIGTAMFTVAVGIAWQFLPQRETLMPSRDSFVVFPRQIDDWEQVGPAEIFDTNIEAALNADDYRAVDFVRESDGSRVAFFSAWYQDQSDGGVHSPEVCLPGSGWEISWLERVNIGPSLELDGDFNINQAIIQKGETRMLVYYWFEQKGRTVAWDFGAKLLLVYDAIATGRRDGAIVRLTTLIDRDETPDEAASRLDDFVSDLIPIMPRFIPGADENSQN